LTRVGPVGVVAVNRVTSPEKCSKQTFQLKKKKLVSAPTFTDRTKLFTLEPPCKAPLAVRLCLLPGASQQQGTRRAAAREHTGRRCSRSVGVPLTVTHRAVHAPRHAAGQARHATPRHAHDQSDHNHGAAAKAARAEAAEEQARADDAAAQGRLL
jgi:hypothetical protein